ncbi:MAG: hydroxysqualene dehydroxylase HpnE [Planctomycetaceae bacterium]
MNSSGSSYPTSRPSPAVGETSADGRPIVIVGGGLAGLAAASALSQHRLPVTLLESRPRLGGRASSVVDASTEMLIDTCQHVAMGCCTNFLQFCKQLNVAHCFCTAKQLNFVAPDGTIVPFAASKRPAPLHLTNSFMRLPYLTMHEKWQLATGIRRLVKLTEQAAADLSFADWLERNHQPSAVVERFWNVVLVSALSESSERISTKYARQVIVEAFLRNRNGWQVYLPVQPLASIYDAMVRELQSRGVTIRVQSGVQHLETADDHIAAVVLRDGTRVPCADCILAVSFDRVENLLPHVLRDHPEMRGIKELQASPISSVHIWFDRPICDLPHAVIVDRFSQWMFNRTLIHASGDASMPSPMRSDDLAASHYYQVVISASRNVVELDSEAAIGRVLDDLRDIWPAARSARVLQSRLMTDHRAVFSPLPGIDRHRPLQQSPIANLQFAGDWTRTGWPATMESAVRSGFLAAENILRRRGGDYGRIVQPGLPTARLGKWLLGL